MNNKIIDEYVNYMGVLNKLSNINFIQNKYLRSTLYKTLQHLIEDRILYRYKIKSPPYHGYNFIEKEEYEIIDNFFNEKKKYMESVNDINEIYHKFNKIKEYFIDIINNKKIIFKNMYNDTDYKIIVSKKYIKYRNLKINLENDFRLKLILERIGKKKFLRMILRYIGYGITGQHCSVPFNTYQYLYDEFNIRGEGFSSPLNSKLLNFNDTVFCTLFKDTDKYIKSLGPFSHKILIKHSDKNWTVNPPYMPNVMLMAYREIMKAFKKIKREDFLIIYLMPKWDNDISYNKFKNCKYLVKLIEPSEGSHYMNCNGRTVHMNGVINSMFFLSRNKNIVTDDKINKLLKLWNTYTDDKINQSFFTIPEII